MPRYTEKPNIVYIYADDLGRGMLSWYGQRHFQTPNIDRLAAEGVRLENYYGCSYCAPARGSLLTGRHDCHTGVWTVARGGVYEKLSDDELAYGDIRELINNTGFRPAPMMFSSLNWQHRQDTRSALARWHRSRGQRSG